MYKEKNASARGSAVRINTRRRAAMMTSQWHDGTTSSWVTNAINLYPISYAQGHTLVKSLLSPGQSKHLRAKQTMSPQIFTGNWAKDMSQITSWTETAHLNNFRTCSFLRRQRMFSTYQHMTFCQLLHVAQSRQLLKLSWLWVRRWSGATNHRNLLIVDSWYAMHLESSFCYWRVDSCKAKNSKQ